MNIKRTLPTEVEPNQLQICDKITIADSEWKVLDVEAGKALIWKSAKIEDHVFNKNGENVCEGSGIQKYLQEDFQKTVPVDILDAVTEEGFFLLTVGQIRKYMPKELDRIATDAYDRTTWYWTASPYVGSGNRVRSISPAGRVSSLNAYGSNGVAPACWIYLKS